MVRNRMMLNKDEKLDITLFLRHISSAGLYSTLRVQGINPSFMLGGGGYNDNKENSISTRVYRSSLKCCSVYP